MGCGCFSPLVGGRKTQRVQSYEGNIEHVGSTPEGEDRLPKAQEVGPSVKPRSPVDDTVQEKQLDGMARRKSRVKDEVRGSSFSKKGRSRTARMENDGPDSLQREGAFTPAGDVVEAERLDQSDAANVANVKKGKGKPKAAQRAELLEVVWAASSEVATGESDETGINATETVRIWGDDEKKMNYENELEATGASEDTVDRAVFGESLEREVNNTVNSSHHWLTSSGQADSPESAQELSGGNTEAAIDESLVRDFGDISIQSARWGETLVGVEVSQHPNPAIVDKGSHALGSKSMPTNPSDGHASPASSGHADPSSISPTATSSDPIHTSSETDGTAPVVWHENSMAVPGPVDKDAASPPKPNSLTPRSADKNRASALQQAFVVADLGFQMEPVRKERPNLHLELDTNGGVPQAADQGGLLTCGPSALEQLSLLQLDVDDDLLSELSPRAESVWTPDTGRPGIAPRRPFAPWGASESESPGKESSFLSDGSVDRIGFGRGEVFQQPNSPGGVVSPVQAALRLIKRSQKLTSPSKKSNRSLAEGPESGTDRSGCDREGDSDGSKGSAASEAHWAAKGRGPGVVPGRVPSEKQKAGGVEKTDGSKEGQKQEPKEEKQGLNEALKLTTVPSNKGGRPAGVLHAVESEGSPASSPVKGSPVGSDSASTGSRRATGVKTVNARRSEKAHHAGSTTEHIPVAANKTQTALRVSSLDLRAAAPAVAPTVAADPEKRSLSRSGSSRRATGNAAPAAVTSPDWRGRRVDLRQELPGKPAGDSDDARWLKARASDFIPSTLEAERKHGPKAPGEASEHWRKIMASLKQPNLSWREKLSQLEESVHLFSDASGPSKFALVGEKSREVLARKSSPETRTTGQESTEKVQGTVKGPGVAARATGDKRESDRGTSTGLAAQGEKALGRSTTTPSRRGVWKSEAGRVSGRVEPKHRESQRGKVLKSPEEGVREKAAADEKKRLARAKSAPRERRERPDQSSVKVANHDLESKQLWLAAEEKRIKEEAVRLAGLAASLERETERLERQRAQAEKLERDMRARFGTAESRGDRPSPQSEGPPFSERWVAPESVAAGMLKRQSSRKGRHREEAATSLSSDAAVLSPPRARSQPGSRASSRPRSRKGEDRTSRSAKDEDSSSSGNRSNRSVRPYHRKKLERSRSAGRLRTSELGRGTSEKHVVKDAWGFSGGEFSGRKRSAKGGAEAGKAGALLRGSVDSLRSGTRGEAPGWVNSSFGGSVESRNVLSKANLQERTAGKAAREGPPGGGREETDSLEALYQVAVGVEKRLAGDTRRALTGAHVDAAAPREGPTSPASSLSSKSGSLSAGERNRNKLAEAKQTGGKQLDARVESKVPTRARARAAEWVETDAETDMEEVRRTMRRKHMQELAELEEFEEIEKTVMGV